MINIFLSLWSWYEIFFEKPCRVRRVFFVGSNFFYPSHSGSMLLSLFSKKIFFPEKDKTWGKYGRGALSGFGSCTAQRNPYFLFPLIVLLIINTFPALSPVCMFTPFF